MVSAPRQIAVRLLRDADSPGDFIEHRIERDRFVQHLRPEDRRLVQELIFGVVRWRGPLDWMIAARTGGRPQRALAQTILRLGFYQLFWLDRVPAYAVINDAVELARRFGGEGLGKFTNAVLRGASRDREQIGKQFEELQQRDPATAWSHPQWLVQRWTGHFGEAATRELLDWNNTPPDTFARLSPRRLAADKVFELWREEGIRSEPFGRDWIPEGLMHALQSHPPLAGLGSFKRGGFYVQDPSTLLAVRQLDPQPGETVLDLCAAPGGKTTYIAQRMENQGTIIAHDPSLERLRLVHDNASRLGCATITTTNVAPSPLREKGRYDRILVDAPCSNTGVFRRRLEARWRLRPEDIGRLAGQQVQLLELAAQLLKPAGRLVYSTCSLESEENHGVIGRFLQTHPQFQCSAERQLTPFRDAVDGAFVAVLERE
jgi:16S rRNA (cytosine967-C5)-methyltransferase